MSEAPTPDVRLSEIGQIMVTARDLPRAIGFYRDTLGIPFLFEAPGMAFFQCGPVRLMVGIPSGIETDHPSSILYFRTSDIAAAYAALAARGVTFVLAPQIAHRAPGLELWLAFFKDSEENTMALMSEVRTTD